MDIKTELKKWLSGWAHESAYELLDYIDKNYTLSAKSENKYPIGGYAPGEYNPIGCEHKLPNGLSSWSFQSEEQSNLGGQNKVSIHVCLLCGEINIGGYRPSKDEKHVNSFHETFHIYHPDAIDAIIKQANLFNEKSKWGRVSPKPTGAVWVKGDYDRLYDQLKEDVNCRIVCYVDYNTRSKNPDGSPYILRDICSIWGENMEFGSRGHGYGSVRFMPGDEKENFIGLCTEMNVEWLNESGTASNKEQEIAFAEWVISEGFWQGKHDKKWRTWTNELVADTTADLHKLWQQSKK